MKIELLGKQVHGLYFNENMVTLVYGFLNRIGQTAGHSPDYTVFTDESNTSFRCVEVFLALDDAMAYARDNWRMQ